MNPWVKSGDGQMWDLNGRPGATLAGLIRPFELCSTPTVTTNEP